MDVPNRLDITTGQLETAVRIVEALANKNFIQRNLPNVDFREPVVFNLFVSDLIVKEKSEDELYIEAGSEDGFEVAAGQYFTILNKTSSRVRLSFFDDNTYTESAMTSEQLQLPEQDGTPVLILEPNTEGAVTTTVVVGNGLKSVWINIEKRNQNATWAPVGPGGNGANMKINNP